MYVEEESSSWIACCGVVPINGEGTTGAELGVEVVGFAGAVEVEECAEGGEAVMVRSFRSLVLFWTAGAARWTGALENQGSCMFDDPAWA